MGALLSYVGYSTRPGLISVRPLLVNPLQNERGIFDGLINEIALCHVRLVRRHLCQLACAEQGCSKQDCELPFFRHGVSDLERRGNQYTPKLLSFAGPETKTHFASTFMTGDYHRRQLGYLWFHFGTSGDSLVNGRSFSFFILQLLRSV